MITVDALQFRLQMRVHFTTHRRRSGSIIVLCMDEDFPQRVAKFSFSDHGFNNYWLAPYAYHMALEGPR